MLKNLSLNLKSTITYSLVALFVAINGLLLIKGFYLFLLVPVFLLLVYAALFQFETLFLIVVFCAPLSLNLEELVGKGGLYLPTEPLLFGMTLIIVFKILLKNVISYKIFYHPITLVLGLHILWLFITSLTSEMPIVSFKFLLARLWFLIPIILFGTTFFLRDSKNYTRFFWIFLGSLAIVVSYTLIQHAIHGFSEESGHWVMSPFFKDHTSYGAVLAMVLPLCFGLYLINKNNILAQFLALGLISLIGFGVVFSYTRAAWVTVLGALILYLLIVFKIKFRFILIPIFIAASWVLLNFDQLTMELKRNKIEHTTENLSERLQSASNISTDASNLERLNRWSSAFEMFIKRPIVGWGPGTYAFVYAPFQAERNLTIISTNFGDGGNAHSEYLGPLSETGFVGMFIMILMVYIIFYKGFTLYSRIPPSDERTILLFTLLGLSTYFVHGILNNYLDIDKVAIPLWGMVAYIIALDIKNPKEKKKITISKILS